MKITLDISDDIVSAFFCGVILTYDGLKGVMYALDNTDLVDGNIMKLSRKA